MGLTNLYFCGWFTDYKKRSYVVSQHVLKIQKNFNIHVVKTLVVL